MKFILAHNCTNGAFELDILLSQNCHFFFVEILQNIPFSWQCDGTTGCIFPKKINIFQKEHILTSL